MLRNNKGITLISLVITLIVLLIVASISIFTVIGNNGVLNNSKKLNLEEQVKMLDAELNQYILEQKAKSDDNTYYSSLLNADQNSLTYNGETLTGNISTIFPNQDSDVLSKIKIQNGSLVYTGNDQSQKDWFSEALNKVNVEVKINNTNIRNVQNLSTLYGETVTGVNTVEGVQWQLFYDDTDNIYLIASDYVPVSTLPSELKKESGNSTQKYKAWFATNDNGNLVGTIMNTIPWCNGSTSSTIISNPLTSEYLKVASNYTSSNGKMKATAFMMDISEWFNFAGNIKGAYAVGGPTIEMFVTSWNSVHNDKITLQTSSDGYDVSGFGTGEGDFGTSTNMWFIKESSKASGMWLIAPSTLNGYSLKGSRCNGYFSNGYIYGTLYGFRPLLAIPKSSLK